MDTNYKFMAYNQPIKLTIKSISTLDVTDYFVHALIRQVLRRPYNYKLSKSDINIILGRLDYTEDFVESFKNLHTSGPGDYNLCRVKNSIYGFPGWTGGSSYLSGIPIGLYRERLRERNIINYLRNRPNGNFRMSTRTGIVCSGFKFKNRENRLSLRLLSNFGDEDQDIKSLSDIY